MSPKWFNEGSFPEEIMWDVTYAGHHPNQCFCWGSTKLAQLSGGPFKAIKPTEDLARKENSRCKLSRGGIFFWYSFLFPSLKTLQKAQLMWLILTFYWEPIFTTQKSILCQSPPPASLPIMGLLVHIAMRTPITLDFLCAWIRPWAQKIVKYIWTQTGLN